jgi:hypothetical protein
MIKFDIPDRFQVAGHPYQIVKKQFVKDDDDDAVFGLHDMISNKIFLAQEFPLGESSYKFKEHQKLNTFWHELFHAFNYYMNNDQDETLAQSFANFMCEFLKTAEYDSKHEGGGGDEFRPFDQEY